MQWLTQKWKVNLDCVALQVCYLASICAFKYSTAVTPACLTQNKPSEITCYSYLLKMTHLANLVLTVLTEWKTLTNSKLKLDPVNC